MPLNSEVLFPAQPHDLASSSKALGIPFVIAGVAEKNLQYQSVIKENNISNVKHLWGTLESMVAGESCLLHPGAKCCVHQDVKLGVTGSPCNPYSTQRSKRFHDGGVVTHEMNDTTFKDVISYYQKFEPHTCVTEQVMGFQMATSTTDPQSPLDKSL